MRTKHRVTGSHGHYGGCIRTLERCDRVGHQIRPSGRHIRPKRTLSGNVLLHLKPVGSGCREPHFQQWRR